MASRTRKLRSYVSQTTNHIYRWDLTYVLIGFTPIDFGCAIISAFWTMYCFTL